MNFTHLINFCTLTQYVLPISSIKDSVLQKKNLKMRSNKRMKKKKISEQDLEKERAKKMFVMK